MTDSTIVIGFAQKDKCSDVRKAAINKLSDQKQVLEDIAKNDDFIVRQTAQDHLRNIRHRIGSLPRVFVEVRPEDLDGGKSCPECNRVIILKPDLFSRIKIKVNDP